MKKTVLLVKKLPIFCTSFDVVEVLSPPFSNLKVLAFQKEKGHSRGRCFLEFESKKEAELAARFLECHSWGAGAPRCEVLDYPLFEKRGWFSKKGQGESLANPFTSALSFG